MADSEGFRLGRLDHVHVYVPDRDEAAAWYSTHLGFEPVERFGFWADGIEGGPLQVSADGGRTSLALVACDERHPAIRCARSSPEAARLGVPVSPATPGLSGR